MKRVHVYYSGSVQGVGFRYTAQELAVSLGISGWVKNLRDGRVEFMGEGKESALSEFLRKINDVFGRYIRDADVEWLEAAGEFSGFGIKFD